MASWEKGNVLGVVGAAAAALLGIMVFWQSYEISKVSDFGNDLKSVGADVRATNTRIDQTYSTLLQQASDIGSIKGDLRAATDKITAAAASAAASAASNAELTTRLTSIVDKQEAQVASIQEIKGSITKIVDAVASQQGELIKIEDKVGTPPRPFPQKKTELLDPDSFVFSSAEFAKAKLSDLDVKGVVTADFDNPATFVDFAKLAAEKPGSFKEMFLVTKDAGVARAMQQVLGK
jgi:hypothetical protein